MCKEHWPWPTASPSDTYAVTAVAAATDVMTIIPESILQQCQMNDERYSQLPNNFTKRCTMRAHTHS